VHGNAQRATVGSGIGLMNVGYLDYGQQRQQDKTHNSHNRQSA
jgi:hypothetical protein